MILAWLLAGALALPLLIVATECLAGLRANESEPLAGSAPSFAVLIPAHDEEAGITEVVAAVRRQLRPCDRVLVIADNCSDATAEVALRAGAAVCRRDDPAQIGKAYALAFGRDVLALDPPAVVVVLDADCLPEPGSLTTLATSAWHRQAAVQGRYLLTADAAASPLVRISAFAFLVKNLVRQRGLQRLGGVALLQGTGMAMPWPLLSALPLATSSLVEDLKLGIDLTLAGHAVRFEDGAGVVSRAGSQAATATQRTRWEHGSITTAAEYLPRVIFAAIGGRTRLLALAGDLLVPPLALLAGVASGALALLVLLASAGVIAAAPAMLLFATMMLTALVLAVTWHRIGQDVLPARVLLSIPHYLLWKQPIYRRLAFNRERRWLRTSRL